MAHWGKPDRLSGLPETIEAFPGVGGRTPSPSRQMTPQLFRQPESAVARASETLPWSVMSDPRERLCSKGFYLSRTRHAERDWPSLTAFICIRCRGSICRFESSFEVPTSTGATQNGDGNLCRPSSSSVERMVVKLDMAERM